jgi:hypothetical protein
MSQCKSKSDGEQCRNRAIHGTEPCRTHVSGARNSDNPATSNPVEGLVQTMCDRCLEAIDAGEYEKAAQVVGLIEKLDYRHSPLPADPSETTEELLRGKKESESRRVQELAHLGVLFGAIYALLAAFLQNSFSLILNISRAWAIWLSLAYFVIALVIVIWAIRAASSNVGEGPHT